MKAPRIVSASFSETPLAGADMPFNVCGSHVSTLGTTQTPTSTESAPATGEILERETLRDDLLNLIR